MHSKCWHLVRTLSMAGLATGLMAIGTTTATAQTTWQATYEYDGVDVGRGIVLNTDNTIVMAGETASPVGTSDVYVVKTDGCYTPLWEIAYDLGGEDRVGKIRSTADGGYIIVGTTHNENPEHCTLRDDIFLLKIDAAGAVQWAHVYGGSDIDEGSDVQVVSDGYVAVGATMSYGVGGRDGYIIKTDLTGNRIWSRTYGSHDEDFFKGCTIAANGDIVAVGETFSFTSPTNGDIFLARVDQTTGVPVPGYPRRYGGNQNDLGWSVVEDLGGDLIIAGGTQSYGGNSEGFLLRTTAFCAPTTITTFGGSNGTGWDEFLDMSILKSSGYYMVTGLFFNPPNGFGNYDMYVGIADPFFNLFSSEVHGGTGDDEGWGITTMSIDGHDELAATGLTTSFGVIRSDMYTIRQDKFGYTGCNDRVPELSVNRPVIECNEAPVAVINVGQDCARTPAVRSKRPGARLLCASCNIRGTRLYVPDQGDNSHPGADTRTIDSASKAVSAGIAGVASSNVSSDVKLYPNPIAKDRLLTLEYMPVANTVPSLAISDMAGKTIANTSRLDGDGRMTIDTEGWTAGTYMVRITIGDRTETRRITVLE